MGGKVPLHLGQPERQPRAPKSKMGPTVLGPDKVPLGPGSTGPRFGTGAQGLFLRPVGVSRWGRGLFSIPYCWACGVE